MVVMEIICRATGGMKNHYILLIKGLLEQGNKVIAVSSLDLVAQEELSNSGAIVYNINSGNKKYLCYLASIIKLVRLIGKHKPKIIHCHGFKAGVLGRLAAAYTRSRTVYTIHSFTQYNKSKPTCNLISLFEKLMARWTSSYIAVSKALKQSMQELIGEGRNIKVIYNALPAIEPKTSINIRDNWSIRDDDTLLGCVARLIPSKGIDILLDAFDQIGHARLKLLIVGEGPDRTRIEKILKDKGLTDKVFLAGHVDSIAEYYKAFDIFVSPSLSEGMGIAVLEAMQQGLAIVAARTGGIPELIVHDQNGLLVEPASSSELALSIKDLIENRDKAIRLGNNARLIALRDFSVEKMIYQTLEVFEQI